MPLIGGLFTLIFCLAPTAQAADNCPNAEFRTGYGAYLPDCRAYEKATPNDKAEQDAPLVNQSGAIYDPQVSADGNRAAYFSQGAFAGSPAANSFYVSTREEDDWATVGAVPKLSVMTGVSCIQGAVAYAEDLSRVLLVLGGGQGFFGCGTDDPPLVPGRPEGVANLYVHDTGSGAHHLISVNPVSGSPANAEYQGASPNLEHIIFAESALLTPDAVAGKMLYAWSAGDVRLVSQVPAPPATTCTRADCVAVAGAGLGGTQEGSGGGVYRIARAVSEDASQIFFHASPPGGVPSLYVRSGDTTTQVDVSQGPGDSGGGHFMTATSDGSSVFFISESKLTPDSTASVGKADLYRYDLDSGALTDLTTADTSGADIKGVVGASDDGEYIYFVANGLLANNSNSEGDTASPGDCRHQGAVVLGTCSLYLLHDGAIRFIATLSATDEPVWGINNTNGGPVGNAWASRVTPDGKHLAFTSTEMLTGYDNTPEDPTACTDSAGNQSPCSQVFHYNVTSNELSCASCISSGAPPLGRSWIEGTKQHAVFFSGPRLDNHSLPRNLTDDGSRIFFNSEDALLPEDTNAKKDVYEYANGDIHLISTGRGLDGSSFFDASSDGSSVYLATREPLVPSDTDALLDLYGARIGGGLVSQRQSAKSPPCQGDACKRQPAAPPVSSIPASAEVAGSGNVPLDKPSSRLAKFRIANLTLAQRRQLATGKRITLRARVSKPGVVRVQVRGRLGRQGRIRTLANGMRRARTAGTVRVGLRLSSSARRYLARHRVIRVAVRVSYSGAKGSRGQRLTLRRTSSSTSRNERRGGRR